MKYFIYSVIGIVSIAVVAALLVVGPPQNERLRRFDGQRIGDLTNIQYQLLSYWQTKGDLPSELLVLDDTLSGFKVPNDPETGVSYGYEKLENNKFKLCAKFNFSSNNNEKSLPSSMVYPVTYFDSFNWSHEAGEQCFERIIDKDKYKINESTLNVKPIM